MSFAPFSSHVSQSAQDLEAELKRRKRRWYTFKSFSFILTGLLLLCLVIVPVARGADMGQVVLKDVGMAFAATVMAALLLGWVAWRMTSRKDMAANVVYSLVVIASGIWTTGLSTHQRSEAQEVFHDTVGKHLVAVSDTAREWFEVGD